MASMEERKGEPDVEAAGIPTTKGMQHEFC